jgi:Na+/proline symporter
MTPYTIIACILAYFGLILWIAYLTTRKVKLNLETFFTANHASKWYVVTFGMVGVTISGVTLISVPGEVGTKGMTYFQIVLGYFVGYWIISKILLPLYYQLKMPSIYTFLSERFGNKTYLCGASFFLISRFLGTTIRFYLMLKVLDYLAFRHLQIPFELTAAIAVLFIYLYTVRGGLQTIIYTDLIQTVFILIAVLTVSFSLIYELQSFSEQINFWNSPYTQIFDWNSKNPSFFFKYFFSGMFITVTMTGLDQDLMQKNLTCRTLQDAQKNMQVFSFVILIVNFLFVLFGALLYTYVDLNHLPLPERTDFLVPELIQNHFSGVVFFLFLMGVIAATYATSDSALAALTTSFCIDILKINNFQSQSSIQTKNKVFSLLTVLFYISILSTFYIEKYTHSQASIISLVLTLAGFSYGPLLGLFAFGLFTNFRVHDTYAMLISLLAPCLSLVLYFIAPLLWNYQFGFEILLINAGITYLGLRVWAYLQ